MYAPDTWIDDERRTAAVLRVVAARAVRQPGRIALVTVALAAILLGTRLALPATFVATISFQLSEGAIADPAHLPRPAARIREYVTAVALNRQRLLEIMARHEISTRFRSVNPTAAVDAFRKDIEVEVLRNSFLLDQWEAAGPRSARVVVSYVGAPRETALAVAQDIGRTLVEHQASGRMRDMAAAAAFTAAEIRQARARLAPLQQGRAQLVARAATGSPRTAALMALEISALDHQIDPLLLRIKELEQRERDVALSGQAQRERLGLTFQLVDEDVRPVRTRLRAWGAVAYGGLVLLLLTPVVAVLLASFDRRVFGSADLAACSFPVLGVVPAFAGDDSRAQRRRFAGGTEASRSR